MSESGIQRRPDRWPGPDDDHVRYNVPPHRPIYDDPEDDELDDFIYPEPGDGYVYVSTVPNPPPIDFDADEARETLFALYTSYLASVGFPQRDELGEELYSTDLRDADRYIGFRGQVGGHLHPFDRTIEVPLTHEAMVTTEFIRHLQQHFFEKFPLWRIRINADSSGGEESLMIYSAVARVGENQCPPEDLTRCLARWNETIRGTRGPRRRQFEEVKRRLPSKAAELSRSSNPFVLVAAFDNWCGDFKRHSVWFLQRESMYRLAPMSFEGLGHGDLPYAVGEDGTMKMGDERWKEGNLDLVQWTMSASDSHVISLSRKRKAGESGSLVAYGETWVVNVAAESIIRDHELKALEQLGD